jgi:prepilin peptidase CpaA
MNSGSLALGLVLIVSAGWDLAKRRIPNPLILFGLLLGLAFGGVTGGLNGLGFAFLGAVVAFALTFPQWAMRWMGGGDAKLMMVVGTFLGPIGVVSALVYATCVHGLVALGMLLLRGIGQRIGRDLLQDPRAPMAVAITIGASLAIRFPLIG